MKLAVLIGTILVMIGVYIIEERSRYWAGILATLPLKTVAVILMVWFSAHENKEVAEVAQSMQTGVFATFVFLMVVYFGMKTNVHISHTLMVATLVWTAIVAVPYYWGKS